LAWRFGAWNAVLTSLALAIANSNTMNSQEISSFVAYLLPTDTGDSVGDGVGAHAFLPRTVQSPECWLIELLHETVGFLSVRYQGGGTIWYRAGESRNEAMGMTFGHVEHSEEFPQIEECQLPTGETCWSSGKRFATRWCKIALTPKSETLVVMAIAIRTTGHPVNRLGGFSCSDPRVNEMYETGIRTVRLCMQEVYEDGVRRDKLPWIFDTIPQALVNYYAYGDRDLFRASWRHFAKEYPGDGIVCTLQLWDYACWWNIGLYAHYVHTEDLALVHELYPTAKQNIDALLNLRDHEGVFRKDNRLEVFGGGEALLFKALLDTANMARLVDDEAASKLYSQESKMVKNAINERFWDNRRGCYIDPRPPHGNIGHRCNVTCVEESLNSFAMLFGIADGPQAKSAASYLQRNLWGPYGSFPIERPRRADGGFGPTPGQTGSPVHNDCVWPVVNFYQMEALFAWKLPQAWELLRRCWGNMIDQGADTYWECVHEDGSVPALWTSLCHGWSAGIAYTLPATVVGVRPLTPGFKTFAVEPHLGPLDWARAKVPTPHGLIEVEVVKDSDGIIVNVIDAPSPCHYLQAN